MKTKVVEYKVSESFLASHSLPVFGQPEKHNHFYTVTAVASRTIEDFFKPLSELKGDLKRVTNELECKYLNDIIEVPTAENVAAYIKNKLPSYVESVNLQCYGDFSVTVW